MGPQARGSAPHGLYQIKSRHEFEIGVVHSGLAIRDFGLPIGLLVSIKFVFLRITAANELLCIAPRA